jgi:hypothetical protein
MSSRPITEGKWNYLIPVGGNLGLSDAEFDLRLDALASIQDFIDPFTKLEKNAQSHQDAMMRRDGLAEL